MTPAAMLIAAGLLWCLSAALAWRTLATARLQHRLREQERAAYQLAEQFTARIQALQEEAESAKADASRLLRANYRLGRQLEDVTRAYDAQNQLAWNQDAIIAEYEQGVSHLANRCEAAELRLSSPLAILLELERLMSRAAKGDPAIGPALKEDLAQLPIGELRVLQSAQARHEGTDRQALEEATAHAARWGEVRPPSF